MKIIEESFLDFILKKLQDAPDSQIDNIVRKNVNDFLSKQSNKEEKFNFIVNISKKSDIQISASIKRLCELNKYYKL